MEPVTIALALAKATGLTDWIGDKLTGTKGGEVAKVMIDLAQQTTDTKNGKDALAAVQRDPNQAIALEKFLRKNEHALKIAPYEDRKDARAAWRIHPTQANQIAAQVMKYNVWFILGMVLIQSLALYFLKDAPALLAAISSVLGAAIKSLFDERKEVTGFYFGGSMDASEYKDR